MSAAVTGSSSSDAFIVQSVDEGAGAFHLDRSQLAVDYVRVSSRVNRFSG